MKKFIIVLMAISLMALAVPALADCDLDFTVDVTKTATVDKYVSIDKYFTFVVTAYIDPDALAECDVFKCDLNEHNKVDSYLGTYTDDLTCSFNNFTGIGQANQAAGYGNNQGNIVAAAIVSTDKKVAAMTEVAVEQKSYFNTLYSELDYSFDTISGSFKEFTGIGQANQSAGHMNNQNNVVAISAGLTDRCGDDGVVAANDTYLTQKNSANWAFPSYALNVNTVTNSFNNFTGIGQVNQAAGSMNNQANVVSIAYTGPKP